MKNLSKRLLTTCGKMPVVQWDRMKNSGPWPLSRCLLANAQRAHAKSLRQRAQKKHRQQQRNLPQQRAASSLLIILQYAPPFLLCGGVFLTNKNGQFKNILQNKKKDKANSHSHNGRPEPPCNDSPKNIPIDCMRAFD